MSGPDRDCTAEVMRAWMSLPLMVSMLRRMPSAFWHSAVMCLRSSWSEAGTKSFQRSQWSVAPCA